MAQLFKVQDIFVFFLLSHKLIAIDRIILVVDVIFLRLFFTVNVRRRG